MEVILAIDVVKVPLTGIGRYTYELAKHLGNVDDINLKLMRAGNIVASLENNASEKISSHITELCKGSKVANWLHRNFINFRQTTTLKHHRDAVFHSPNFYLPEFDGASVVTIHDLSVYNPAFHPPAKSKMMMGVIEKSVKRASMFITDSAFNRQELIDKFGISPAKVVSIPLGFSAEFKPRSELECLSILQKHNLRWKGFCFFSGTIEPRKNILTLLDAYSKLDITQRTETPLVLCGHKGWRSEEIHERIKKAESEGWVKYLSFVSDEDLPVLYSAALLFLFPSWYEGFGLPVLEAMASGTPVICSNVASLPEIVGGQAALVDPWDANALFDFIAQGLADEYWRTCMSAGGLKQAAKFCWKKCAGQTAQVYKLALECR